MPEWYEAVSSPFLSAITFADAAVVNLIGTLGDAVGAPEKFAGRLSLGPAELRAQAQIRAGLDPKDDRSFTEYIEDGEIGKGVKSLGLTLAENLPQIITTIYNPTTGLAIGGVSAGTASYMDVRNRLDMTPGEKVTTMAVSGAAEYLFERISLTDIKLARKALGIDEAIELAGDTAKKEARAKAMSALRKEARLKPIRQVGEQFLSEGLEEVGVELTNGMLSFMISGELTDPRDVLESFLIGGIMGGGTVAVPTALAKGLNGLATRANMKEFKRVTDEIASLREQLNSNMSEYDRSKIQDKIVQLGMVQQSIAAASMDVYKGMPSEAQKQMLGIHKDLNAALNTYNKLTDEKAKKQQLGIIRDLIRDKDILEQEYGGQALDAVKNNPQNIKVGEKYNKSFDESRTFNDGVVKEGNGITKSEAKIMSRIFGIVKGDKAAKVVVHNSLRSLVNSNDAARKIFRDSKGRTRSAAYVTTAKDGSKTIHVLSPHAYRQYKQYTGRDSGAAKTYAHEVIHTALDQMLATDPIAQERLYEELNQEAAKGNVFAKEALKFAEKYTDDKGFDENTRKNEALTEFLALMTRGNNLESMKRDNPGLLQKIRNIFNDLLASVGYTDIRIEDDADLFTVANNLSTAMRTGSTIKFGRDIAAEARQEATQQPEPQPEVAPAMSAEDSNLDDIAFTLLNAKYDDPKRIAELTSLLTSDENYMNVVQRDIDKLKGEIPTVTDVQAPELKSEWTSLQGKSLEDHFKEVLSVRDTMRERWTSLGINNNQKISELNEEQLEGYKTILIENSSSFEKAMMDRRLLDFISGSSKVNEEARSYWYEAVMQHLSNYMAEDLGLWLEGDWSYEDKGSVVNALATHYENDGTLAMVDTIRDAVEMFKEDGIYTVTGLHVDLILKTEEITRRLIDTIKKDRLSNVRLSPKTSDISTARDLISLTAESAEALAMVAEEIVESQEETPGEPIDEHYQLVTAFAEGFEEMKSILMNPQIRSIIKDSYGTMVMFGEFLDNVMTFSANRYLEEVRINETDDYDYYNAMYNRFIDDVEANPESSFFGVESFADQENILFEATNTNFDSFPQMARFYKNSVVGYFDRLIDEVESKSDTNISVASVTTPALVGTTPQPKAAVTLKNGREFHKFKDFLEYILSRESQLRLPDGIFLNDHLVSNFYESYIQDELMSDNEDQDSYPLSHYGDVDNLDGITATVETSNETIFVRWGGIAMDEMGYQGEVENGPYDTNMAIWELLEWLEDETTEDGGNFRIDLNEDGEVLTVNLNDFVDITPKYTMVGLDNTIQRLTVDYLDAVGRPLIEVDSDQKTSVDKIKEEAKALIKDVIDRTTDLSSLRMTLYDVVRKISGALETVYVDGKSIDTNIFFIGMEDLDFAKDYPNIVGAYKHNPLSLVGRALNNSSSLSKIIYTAAIELRDEDQGLNVDRNEVLAPKVFDMKTDVNALKYVSLIGQTTDMFTSEFKAESPLVQALAPETLKMKKATPDQWMSLFSKSAPTSQEAEFINLRGWLDETYVNNGRKSISAEAVRGFVAQNIIQPFITTPYGSYMWSRAELVEPVNYVFQFKQKELHQ